MISEKNICELLSCLLPSGRMNNCFESDAEVIEIKGAPYLFTTDEFSGEDLFRENAPYDLGWNIASGALSDIFACGGQPLFYAHALTVNAHWDAEFLGWFAAGVRDVLQSTGTGFIGGDCGRSELWRCTASVIGACGQRRISRMGATPGDSIYLTGQVGAGNLQAALRLCPRSNAEWADALDNRFVLRQRESAVICRHASAGIDTSDGVWAALTTIADLNRCGYQVEAIPYLPGGLRVLKEAGMPKPLLFLGECGEYELLFTVSPEREEALLADGEKNQCTFRRLGQIVSRERVLDDDGRRLDLGSLRLQARSFETPQEYLQALINWLQKGQGISSARL
jgi:thiamine-monophosphate kinase